MHTRKMDLIFQLTAKETVYVQGIELVALEIRFDPTVENLPLTNVQDHFWMKIAKL